LLQVSKLAMEVMAKEDLLQYYLKSGAAPSSSNPQRAANTRSISLPKSPLKDVSLALTTAALDSSVKEDDKEDNIIGDSIKVDSRLSYSTFLPDTDSIKMSANPLKPSRAPPIPTSSKPALPVISESESNAVSSSPTTAPISSPKSDEASKKSPNEINTGNSSSVLRNSPSNKINGNASTESKYEKYIKMKALLPEQAIRHRMAQDGIPFAEIEALFNTSGPKVPEENMNDPPPGMKPKPKIVIDKKLKGLYWTKIKPNEIKGTIWEKVVEPDLLSQSKKAIEELFANSNNANVTAAVAAKGRIVISSKAQVFNQNKGISLYEGTRTQNVLIILGRMRRRPAEIFDLITQVSIHYKQIIA
jgi:hypothetical protein